MKKHGFEKILSLLTAITILFTMAAIPAMAEDVTVDFTAAENIAYGKTVTHIKGTNYSGRTPGEGNQLATDGDITTYLGGTGNNGGDNGMVFSIDLGAEYNLSEITIYVNTTRTVNMYKGQGVNADNLIGTAVGAATTVNGTSTYAATLSDIAENTTAQYITFEYASKYEFTYREIYIKGTPVQSGGGTTEPEQPTTPTKTVNFSEAANIAYGKTVTHIGGHYYSSGLAPDETRQWATDGDITTFHNGYGKVNGETVGVTFSLDLGKTYRLSQLDLYLASSQSERGYKVYKGTAVDENNLIATVSPAGSTAIVNGTEVSPTTFTFTDDVETQYLTFYYESGSGFCYHEIYLTGTEVTSSGGVDTPTGETIDFSQNNLVYQSTAITRVDGSTAAKFTSDSPNMVDGDVSTSYEWSGGTTATFTIDLGAEYTLSDFVLYEATFNRGFTVSLSTDGSTTTNTKEVTSTDFVQTTVNGTEIYKGALTYTTETARYITVSYPSRYSFIVAELLVKGTPVQTGGGTTEPGEPTPPTVTVDFTAATNVAYDKVVTGLSGGAWWGNGQPSGTNKILTDGNLATVVSGDGDGGADPVEGMKYKIDLGAEYDLSTLTLYGLNKDTNIYAGDFTVDANDGYKVKDAQGNAATPIGTITVGENAIVNGTETSVSTLDLTGTRARYLVFEYTSKYGYGVSEIHLTGTIVPGTEDQGTIYNLTSSKNLAYNKVVNNIVAGVWWSSSGTPSATNKKATDGDLTTGFSGDGDNGTSNPKAGNKIYIDLGEEYNLTKIVLFGMNRNVKIYNGALTAQLVGNEYLLYDADGNLATPLGTIPAGVTEKVNGVDIGVSEYDLTGVRARYLTIDYHDRYGFELKEIYVEKIYEPTDELQLEMITSQQPEKITEDLTLPTELENGTTITWASSSPHVISTTGEVNRQKTDMPVTLTAAMVMNGQTYYKEFKFTVLAADDENIAWSDVFDYDFVPSERDGYVMKATDADGNIVEDYFTNPDMWEEEFLADGGYKVNNKGLNTVLLQFAETLAEDADAAAWRVTFTIQLPQKQTDSRYWPRTIAGEYSCGVFIQENRVGFGPTSSYVDRNWYVNDVDYVNQPMTITLTYKNGYVYPEVNGQKAVRADDGTNFFALSKTNQYGYLEPQINNAQANPTIFYDYKVEKGIDPTSGCDYSALTTEDTTRITEDLTLMSTLKSGATVTWSSSNPAIIAADGTVTRQQYNEKVTLTACINYNNQDIYKSFDFIVVGADKDTLNFILEDDDFNATTPYYVKTAPVGSTVKEQDGKLTFRRKSEGELSAQKYFVTNLASTPYIVEGDKIILEQYLNLLGKIDGADAYLYNEDGEVIATYGFKKTQAGATVFFVNAGGEDVTVPYSRGQEIFVRVEVSTTNKQLNVFVDNVAVTNTPFTYEEAPSVSSVKYVAGAGEDGFLTIDNLIFMLEGTEHDKFKVQLDYANLTIKDVTTQDPEMITSSLALTPYSRWGSSYTYSSSNKAVLSDDGFVSRPAEDTEVTLTVTVSKGAYSESRDFTFIIKGIAEENMATGNLVLSSGAIEGSSDKNAIDGLDETAFVTDAHEKFFAICFDKATTFNKVVLKEAKNEFDEYGVTGHRIEVSNDGNDWSNVVYTGTTVGDNYLAVFDQVTAQYVRYYVTSLTGTQTGLREFIVLYEPVPEVAIDLDLDKVNARPTDYVITGDLTLPTLGEYGSVITWKSSHPDIVTDDGRLISTPEKDTIIKLTATLTNGGFTRTKEITRSVKGSSSGESGGNGGSEKPGTISGGGSGGGGGGSSSDEKEDPKPVDPKPEEPIVTPSYNGFKDVASDRWSYDYIMELKEAGIVSGDGENFRPTDKVTREEFVKMLVLSLGITPEGTADFDDVASDAWYHDYIAVAVDKGIVNGLSDTEFGIGRSISRQDMAVMTVRALKAFEVELQGGEAPVFTDDDEIADYATDAVQILAAAGILNGSDGKFAPTDNLTREQAAKVLCMIRKELTK